MYLFGVLFIDNLYVPPPNFPLYFSSQSNKTVQRPRLHNNPPPPLRRLLLPQKHRWPAPRRPALVERSQHLLRRIALGL